ncbi:hypothetical protein DH2020_039837 [Rehmannia glutinosa]|uniref:Uncharacterized protein n=1 Tax=Rehmannia glutinosa TaxID=99300 RepID=A0ABR0UVX9_REHGL
MAVRELFNEGDCGWNIDVVQQIFPAEMAKQILSIPIRNTSCQDRIAWPHSTNGKYTVKTGYQLALLQNEKEQNGSSSSRASSTLWNWIWRLPIPPKVHVFLWKVAHGKLPVRSALVKKSVDNPPFCPRCGDAFETIEHSLRDCPWSQLFWRASPLRLDRLVTVSNATIADMMFEISKTDNKDVESLFAMLLWSLWYARNLFIFQQKDITHQQCFETALKSLHDYQMNQDTTGRSHATTPAAHWQAPPEDTYKINTDASIIQGVGTGIGVVIRDHFGSVIHSLAKKIEVEYPVDIAEALACWEGLNLAHTLQLSRIHIESDCLQVVQAVQRKDGDISYLGSLADEIRREGRKLRASYYARIVLIHFNEMKAFKSYQDIRQDEDIEHFPLYERLKIDNTVKISIQIIPWISF